MLIEADRCIGCDVCLKACKDEFVGNDYPPYSASQPESSYGYGSDTTFGWPNTPSKVTPWVSHGHLWIDVREQTEGSYPNIKVRYIPKPCMQCDDSPCVKASNNDAVYKRPDGIVIIDPEKSKDQTQIVDSCPYDRIYLNSVKMIPQKCTFCAHLIDKGMSPRCVEACPLKVITFGDLDDPDSEVSKKVKTRKAKPLHEELGTQPKVYYS
jgi:Fe-S-cluster-containing dehydrogenase component